MTKKKKKANTPMTKKQLRLKRKKSLINYETKNKIINRKFKNIFKSFRKSFYKTQDSSEIKQKLSLFVSSVGKLQRRNIIHKNKLARLMSKAALFSNKIIAKQS